MNILEVRGLRYRYGKKEALKGLDFLCKKGEIFCVLGPNGSGKSTLFKILSTSFRPSEGQVLFRGEDLFHELERKRFAIGVVFQAPALDAKLTVEENLRFQGMLYGLNRNRIRERIQELGAVFELENLLPHKVETLSGGWRRRVELAKAFIHGPEFLVLDEPSTGLDLHARRKLWQHLNELAREWGITVLVTTHWMEEAENADCIMILDEGKVVGLGKPEDLKREVGKEVLILEGLEQEAVFAATLAQEFPQFRIRSLKGKIEIESTQEGIQPLLQVLERVKDKIRKAIFRHASLEDVFMLKTGHAFYADEQGIGQEHE